jgi:hypothetical protein
MRKTIQIKPYCYCQFRDKSAQMEKYKTLLTCQEDRYSRANTIFSFFIVHGIKVNNVYTIQYSVQYSVLFCIMQH